MQNGAWFGHAYFPLQHILSVVEDLFTPLDYTFVRDRKFYNKLHFTP